MLKKFKRLNQDKQVLFLLGLSETVVDILSTSPNFEAVNNTLKICWEWLQNNEHSADEIYNLLDDGAEETGLFMLMQDETEELKELAFGCIVDAVSYTNWIAFKIGDQEYLPAPIENVDESLVEHFLEGFYQITQVNRFIAERLMTILELINENQIPVLIRNRAQLEVIEDTEHLHN
ncbi:Imm6 family immunity protein [Paenibacillus alvei]|uniref:Imm6 family immunity protein n=1 Tax=Niallia sp. FSL R7-0271 TaxID=2921678 RepID=UPI0030F4FFD3